MRWLILCNNCMDEIDPENIEGIFLAKYGDQSENTDRCVLACIDWAQCSNPESTMFLCDECGKEVAVHPSSQWFIDSHREERDKTVEAQ